MKTSFKYIGFMALGAFILFIILMIREYLLKRRAFSNYSENVTTSVTGFRVGKKTGAGS